MSLAIGQAVSVADLLRKPEYYNEGGFHSERVQRLSQTDRKICYKSLSWLEKAKLPDWSKEPEKKLDEAVIQNLKVNIDKDIVEADEKKVVWYVAPFIWIAKKVHSFWLGCLNVLGLRVSSKMLEDKIKRDRSLFAEGQQRFNEITKNEEAGLLEAKKKELQQKLDERNQIVVTQLDAIKDVLKVVNHLWCLDENEKLSRDAASRWNIPGYDDATIQMADFKSIVMKFFNNNDRYKASLAQLFEVANNAESTDQDLREALERTNKAALDQLEALKTQADEANAALNKTFNEEKTLLDEAELLRKKFGF